MFKSDITKQLVINCLNKEQLQEFDSETSLIKLGKGQMVFSESGIPFGCYILVSGKVKLFKTGILGKKQIFHICKENDLFGFHPILSDGRYPDSGELLEDSELLFIPTHLFKKLLKSNNELCITMLKALSLEFERLIGQETMLAQKTVFERVCTVLYYVSSLYKNENDYIIPLNRNDLSDLSGTVKETLVRVLHDLKADKVIETTDKRGTIKILDLQNLKKRGEIIEGDLQ